MCRLLFVKSENIFDASDYLRKFAGMSKASKEFQGHGWGCSFLLDGKMQRYRSIVPVWEDDMKKFAKTTLLIAHARSAFRDEGISVENNMPFYDERFTFVFNGELRGVKIKSEGRIGAEKIFNYVKRFYNGDISSAIAKATEIIAKRTDYIRAMNFIICEGSDAHVYTKFSEDAEYFTMHYRTGPETVISSMPLDEESGWQKLENNSYRKF